MDPLLFAGLLALIVLFATYRFLRTPLSYIRGPRAKSFFLGNAVELFRSEVGDVDLAWKNMFGDIVRFKSAFGEDQLLIADPKALQYILNTGHSYFPKQPERNIISGITSGKSLVYVHGETHKRLKKVMSPGMGARQTAAFVEVSTEIAEAICSKWMDLVNNSADGRALIDIYPWASSATLDVIGKCGLGVSFGCVEETKVHKLALCFRNMPAMVFGSLSMRHVFALEAFKYIPTSVLMAVFENSSDPRCSRLRHLRDTTDLVAKDLIKVKTENFLRGEGGEDVLSLLIKASMDTGQTDYKPSLEDLVGNVRVLMLAGHETTANTFVWTLLELARRPHIQSRLRDEIRERETVMSARGDSSFTLADFDAMRYLNAVIKESLRYNPGISHIPRMAAKEDVIPLSRPIVTQSGKLIHELTIPKGTRLTLSVTGYNRNRDMWGEDAHEFNPDRWLNGAIKNGVPVGVYGNLLTFNGGPRACLGWRLAVAELQALLAYTINRFEFALSEKAARIRREQCGMMVPCVEGEVAKGAQMPLVVSMAPR